MNTRLLPVLVALLATAPASAPARAQDLHQGARHPSAVDATRFVTSRDVPPLPLPDETDAYVFAIIGDRTGGPADGVAVLADAVKDINLLEPDLVMTVGDLVEGYNQTDAWLTQMREFRGIMDGLLCPWFPVAGNHDVYWRGPGRPAGEHEANYEMHFGPLWYAFAHKDCWFVVLYSDEGNPETGEKTFNRPECQVMSDEQLAWLRSVLGRAADARHVFVFLHHPRWLRGNYGDDWERVHGVLAAAGNVRAVFAGHIHRMRYDGTRDGIEYVTLATTGGVQDGHAPAAGYLHHYHVVTVRPDQIAMAALPVGAVMDVRAITGRISDETAALAAAAPRVGAAVPVEATGAIDAMITVHLANPVSEPVELTIVPDTGDPRWRWEPDHDHAVIAPGTDHAMTFRVRRAAHAIDDTFRPLELVVDADYLAEGARYPIRTRRFDVPLAPDLPPTPPADAGDEERALALDGVDDCLRVGPRGLHLPDGPLTVECWMHARSLGGQSALVSKTENSEFALFARDGRPSFWICLGPGYVTVEAAETVIGTERWHHVAGVFDGREVRLYVDGRVVAAKPGAGVRRTNPYPLYVGAELAGHDRVTDHFDGWIDEVRVSTTARYDGDGFTPSRRHAADEDTALLLHLDALSGPWTRDESPHAVHPVVRSAPRIETVPAAAGR